MGGDPVGKDTGMHEHGIEHEGHATAPGERIPAILTSALAVLLALVSLGGHRAHTEAILMQAKATDQWAYYQASRIKLSTQQDVAESVAEILNQLAAPNGAEGVERSRSYDEKVKIKVKK